jgi:hypothetical protein
VLGPRVLALGHLAHAAQRCSSQSVYAARTSAWTSWPQCRSRSARPHHQRVAAARLELVEVASARGSAAESPRRERAARTCAAVIGVNGATAPAVALLPERRVAMSSGGASRA